MSELALKVRKPRAKKVVDEEDGLTIEVVKPIKKSELAVEKPIYRTYEDYPPEKLYLYAGFDCIVTSELLSEIAPVCAHEPSYIKSVDGKKVPTTAMSIFESYARYTTPAQEFIVDLELNGIRYDVAGNRTMAARMVSEVAELERQIFAELGKELNLDSGDVMAELLFVEKGFEVETRTKTGEPSTDGEALAALAKKYELPWLRLIAKRKDIVSIYRTFIENYIDDFVKPDGKIHSSYNLHGTSSFRISGEAPNFTQIPRPKHGYNIRDLFIVEDDYVFIALDFSSAEVKVLGAISRDPMLLKAIAEGMDFHSFSASQMMGVEYDFFVGIVGDDTHPRYKEFKGLRQRAKVLTFSILYGSTAGGIARQLAISVKEAEGLMELYFSKFPLIKEYIQDMHNECQWNKYGVSSFGQRKMAYGALPCFEGTAVYAAALRNMQNVR